MFAQFLYIVSVIRVLLLWLLKTLIILYFVYIECTCIFDILFSFSVLLVVVLPILLPSILLHLLYRVIYYFILKFCCKFITEQEKHNII